MDQAGGASFDYIVSIIIATYNAGQHLRDCLSSIERQTAKHMEILILDGGSTDHTLSILQECTLPGLSWSTGPDKGIYDALNKGVRIARGRWFYFMGSDDQLLPGFSDMVAQLQTPNTVYYGQPKGYYLGDARPDYELLGGEFSCYKLAKYPLNHQVIFYPAMVFLKYRYQPKYIIYADYALNLQVWGDRDFRKKFVPVEIALYNMTGFSTSTLDLLFKKDKPRLIKRSMGNRIYYRWLFKVLKKKLRGETW